MVDESHNSAARFQFSASVQQMARQVMADGVLDFQRDGQLIQQIIDALYADAMAYLVPYLPAVTGHSLIELVTQQLLALDEQFGWDAPDMGEEKEDHILAWMAARRVRALLQGQVDTTAEEHA